MSMKLFKTARGCTKRKAPEYSRIGTAHFTSLLAAQRYYAGYGYSAADVGCKLEMQEIFIGRPTYCRVTSLAILTTVYGMRSNARLHHEHHMEESESARHAPRLL